MEDKDRLNPLSDIETFQVSSKDPQLLLPIPTSAVQISLSISYFIKSPNPPLVPDRMPAKQDVKS